MNKKWGIALLGLLAAAGLFYFTVGKGKLIEEMQTQVHRQLSVMAQQGFKVETAKKAKDQEHIVLVFEDPQKITALFQAQGIHITPETAAMLQGLKVAVDLHYLPDTSHAVSADIYPLTLPKKLLKEKADPERKKVIAHLQEMLKRKAILLHIALSKTGSHFDGSMKDINETIQTRNVPHITMKGFDFNGDMKQGKLKALHEDLKFIGIEDKQGLHTNIKNIHADYIITGDTPYDDTLNYTINNITIGQKDKFAYEMNGTHVDTISHNQNNLLDTEVKTAIKTATLTTKKSKAALEDIILEMKADHLDINALKILQNRSASSKDDADKALKQLLSKGVVFEIPNFSIARIHKENQTLQGLTMHAKFKIDKGFDPAAARRSPLAVLDKIDAEIDIALSNDLFAMIAQQPQSMMVLMLFPPKDMGDKKQYIIQLHNGKLTLNGKAIK